MLGGEVSHLVMAIREVRWGSRESPRQKTKGVIID